MERMLREPRRRGERMRAKAEALEKEANAAVAPPTSKSLLDSRRAEVEALDPGALDRPWHRPAPYEE